jgi:hypothetical protein
VAVGGEWEGEGGFLIINNNSTKSNADLNSLYGTIKAPIDEIKK